MGAAKTYEKKKWRHAGDVKEWDQFQKKAASGGKNNGRRIA